MKNILTLTTLICCLLLTACSSDDEPQAEYTGPWVVIYYESYHGMHNNSEEFMVWFQNHIGDFDAAIFEKSNGESWILQASNDDWIELNDYGNWYNGEIQWIETIDKASEEDIKTKAAEFESFSITDEISRHYDSFKAHYQRMK
ncbi:hypothetical protein [uncultured Muribaculum sp.]|uniref:hypothetical protein n=1 Tax=uncultured Muribaculum sp. TaxID=1918613 RepID=UPI0025F2F810|nr:hypothetical protein [uncultured Muribaculum sp.]